MSKNFKQFDSRWGSMGYPYSPYTVRGSGCGPTSLADIIVNNPDHMGVTPATTAKYMRGKGYAIPGQGTTWDGMTQTLKHYGFKVSQPDTVSEFMAEMKKANRWGVMLVNSNYAPDGTRWTSGGHYVAVVDVKTKGEKRYFYTYDPGARAHNGWYCYETSIKGCINKFWVGKLKLKVPSSKLKKGTKKKKETAWLQLCLNKVLGTNLTPDGIFGDKTVKAVNSYKKKCGFKKLDGIYGPKTQAKLREAIE